MQCQFCSPIFARAFTTPQSLKEAASRLFKKLKLEGLPVNQPVEVKKVAVLGYTQWLPHEVLRILRKLEFSPWSRNSSIWVHKGSHYPIQVLEDRVILLGETVPDWTAILKELHGYATPQFSVAKYPLGSVDFMLRDGTQFLKDFGFKATNGKYYSEDIGLSLQFANGRFVMYQASTGYTDAKTITIQPTGSPLGNPEREDISQLDKELIDDRAPALEKYRLPPAAIEKLKQVKSNSPNQLKLLTIKYLWNQINKIKFESKLEEPNLEMMRDQGSNFKLRGYWQPFGRRLALSPRLFNAKPEIFLEILVHEMCHQATSEISHVYGEPEKGHGPVWKSWMVKCGLDPSRYDRNTNDEYLTPQQRKVADYVKTHKLQPKDERRGVICGMYNSKDGTIREVVILTLKIWKQRAAAEVMTSKGQKYSATIGLLCWLPKYKFQPTDAVKRVMDYHGIEQLIPATK